MQLIEGLGVRLRPAGPGDRERFREILGCPEVARWWGDPEEETEEACAPPDGVRSCAIELRPEAGADGTGSPGAADGTGSPGADGAAPLVVGIVQAWEEPTRDFRHAGMDIAVHPDWHRKGIGGAALYVLAHYLFEVDGHHRLTIDPAADNEPAISLYRKLGFRPVGVMREYERRRDGSVRDGLLMDMLAGELVEPGRH
ncbi:GNAT family N-acetyltransferase [Streptomyces sulfonofaciens]|uniref:GNAT family N-acetyltransferase n=1 Tax=Streptomyces sulfonofaciens TaxID=68272 RepID=A0A919KW53_9ACTN|nr:GNAT family protein [Streptomyces sulfonofaciens]GHH74743.1 GNAT family N-acetyltransferase [Streptomyces sulfonofaciens]